MYLLVVENNIFMDYVIHLADFMQATMQQRAGSKFG
jgi:hypothetical protein